MNEAIAEMKYSITEIEQDIRLEKIGDRIRNKGFQESLKEYRKKYDGNFITRAIDTTAPISKDNAWNYLFKKDD